MTSIAYVGPSYHPTTYPSIGGPILPGPSAPTGGGVTTVKPQIEYGTPRTFIPTLTPRAPAPTPAPGYDCDGCNTGKSGGNAPPIPGAAVGQPLQPGGNGMQPNASGAAGGAEPCGCSSESLEKFFKDVPVWVWLLVVAAFFFGRR